MIWHLMVTNTTNKCDIAWPKSITITKSLQDGSPPSRSLLGYESLTSILIAPRVEILHNMLQSILYNYKLINKYNKI